MTFRFGGDEPNPYFLGEHPVRRIYIGSHSLWVANPLEATLLASGAFTYSGYGMDSYVPELESGLFSFEGGEDTDFQFDLSIALESGEFAVTGFEIEVDIISVDLNTGTFTLNGFDLTLDLPIDVGAFVLTGFDATFDHNPGVPTDPFYANVILLVGAEGIDGSTAFVDESPLAKTITPFGNVQIDTAQFKFGASSALFDGSVDSFTIPHATFGVGDFTAETFMRFTAINNAQRGNTFFSQYGVSNQTRLYFKLHTETSGIGRVLRFAYTRPDTSTFFFDSSAWTPILNTWYHVAIDRSGSVIRMYVDGVMIGTATEIPNHNTVGTIPIKIGRIDSVSGFTADHNGHMDEIRLTDGSARYASDAGFTVPAAAYPRS